jgi:hypothetical protein
MKNRNVRNNGKPAANKKRVARTDEIRKITKEFKRVWGRAALRNADHRIDQTIQHFRNVESFGFGDTHPDHLLDELDEFLSRARKRSVSKKTKQRIEQKLRALIQMAQRWSEQIKDAQAEIDAMSYWAQQSEEFYESYGAEVSKLLTALADTRAA